MPGGPYARKPLCQEAEVLPRVASDDLVVQGHPQPRAIWYDDMALVKEDLQDGAETLIVSYGIISRSATVAVKEVRSRGEKISSLIVQTLWPVPKGALTEAMEGVKKVIVPEMNMGQYLLEIERLAPPGVEVVGVNKMNTTLVSPREILEQGGLL